VNGRPEYIRQACEASLKHSGLDHVDSYYQHRNAPFVIIEETVWLWLNLSKKVKLNIWDCLNLALPLLKGLQS
jgi:aryl-alcohol dehydrogenase-like predicted oxidoreductase